MSDWDPPQIQDLVVQLGRFTATVNADMQLFQGMIEDLRDEIKKLKIENVKLRTEFEAVNGTAEPPTELSRR